MNNRIKELEPQCWEHNEFGLNFNYEKFAELIVQECANMAESFHRHQYDFTGNLELHEFIKEHFGVEE
jgi:hypothetical protein